MEFALNQLIPLFGAHGVTLLVTTAEDNDMAWFSACKLKACHCIPLLSGKFVKSSLCESQVKTALLALSFSVVFFHKQDKQQFVPHHSFEISCFVCSCVFESGTLCLCF